ncbi:ADP-forming succinate--CoA ligase subunit beta [Candidatus Protochlamydia phocaeensis]|uniref:ADP-forming succinate--CoA ligase subunit beta n=1 Tax=Candidatus Protochlamydia phocaeensis TaxID=1414722 RepID=UPI0008380D61|nr:ADP-forming succinate--CoA ligase subunit beta [Candidatus Protochlamydia phocaeensis]
MNTHEFQAKQILQRYGIPIPPFYVVSSLPEVEELLRKHEWQSAVLKVQIHAGGRGKAGGVKVASSPEAIRQAARELLGKKIINQQTGPEGMVAHQLLISPTIAIAKEFYLGAFISRERAQSVVIASPVGGVDIEQVAQQTPEKVLIIPIPLEGELRSYQLLRLVKFMGWKEGLAKQGMALIKGLVQAFSATDASLLEINPLVETKQGELVALDAKLVVDDNALFRQPEIKAFFDPTQVSANEARAQQQELAYVALDGNIGCMVNGAGLAMATMDIIQYFGGRPANFLDVGGGASKEKVAEGFKILLSDPKVKAILVNIFGGIMNCETLASGIIEAAREQHLHVPLIVRMEGTNVEKGKQLLQESHLNIKIANSLTEAAQEAVNVAKS